jgi:hypothetical protein
MNFSFVQNTSRNTVCPVAAQDVRLTLDNATAGTLTDRDVVRVSMAEGRFVVVA